MTKEHHKNGIFDQRKNNELFMERKWINRYYHVQDNADVAHKDVRMYCNTNQFHALTFNGTHFKPHGSRGLSKNYHLRFYPKRGNGVCKIRRIPCTCVACTSMVYTIWIAGILSDEKERYKPVTNCTYWQVLGPFNNWNIIQFSHK